MGGNTSRPEQTSNVERGNVDMVSLLAYLSPAYPNDDQTVKGPTRLLTVAAYNALNLGDIWGRIIKTEKI